MEHPKSYLFATTFHFLTGSVQVKELSKFQQVKDQPSESIIDETGGEVKGEKAWSGERPQWNMLRIPRGKDGGGRRAERGKAESLIKAKNGTKRHQTDKS